jgi:hypothetical protein
MSRYRTNYNSKYDVATPGLCSGDTTSLLVQTFVNNGGASKEQWTIATPATVDNSTEYVITVDELTLSYTTDGTATQAELVTGLQASYDANILAGARFEMETSGTTLLITAKFYDQTIAVSVNSGDTTNDLTATKSTSASTGATVPFGRCVARTTGDAVRAAKLPTADTDVILGITLNPKDVERNGIGDAIATRTVYKANEPMDVLVQTNSAEGIWVECVESDITIDDTIYVSVASGYEGMATKTSTDNINISSYASFASNVQTAHADNVGSNMILVRFNKP